MNRDNLVNAALLAVASLGLINPGPAEAQRMGLKVFGTLAGVEYCKLRAAGVSHDQALDFAIRDNMSRTMREPVFRTAGGQETRPSAIDFANYVSRRCPQAWPMGKQI
jgi:hypothetical protein